MVTQGALGSYLIFMIKVLATSVMMMRAMHNTSVMLIALLLETAMESSLL